MYCNDVDNVSDIVFVTFLCSTQIKIVHIIHTQMSNFHTYNSTITSFLHINLHFLQVSSILLTKCISILMLQINSHAKKWRFTS